MHHMLKTNDGGPRYGLKSIGSGRWYIYIYIKALVGQMYFAAVTLKGWVLIFYNHSYSFDWKWRIQGKGKRTIKYYCRTGKKILTTKWLQIINKFSYFLDEHKIFKKKYWVVGLQLNTVVMVHSDFMVTCISKQNKSLS